MPLSKLHEVICCVYRIRSLIDNKVYIGCTVDYYLRKARHIRELEYQYHCNTHLQRAFDKYGRSNFKWAVLEICDPEQKFGRENFWIKKFESANPAKGYNKTYYGDTVSKTSGYYLTVEEVRAIKKRIAQGDLLREIAANYDMRIQTISNIKKGRAWASVEIEPVEALRLRRKFTADNIHNMFRLRLRGLTIDQIARRYGTSSIVVLRILKRQRYSDIVVNL